MHVAIYTHTHKKSYVVYKEGIKQALEQKTYS